MNYDRLKNVEQEEQNKLVCDKCGTDKIELAHLGKSYRPEVVDNKDILDENERRRLDKLPTLRQLLLNGDNGNTFYRCYVCNTSNSLSALFNRISIKAWVNEHLKV